jgi:hypothetical protein
MGLNLREVASHALPSGTMRAKSLRSCTVAEWRHLGARVSVELNALMTPSTRWLPGAGGASPIVSFVATRTEPLVEFSLYVATPLTKLFTDCIYPETPVTPCWRRSRLIEGLCHGSLWSKLGSSPISFPRRRPILTYLPPSTETLVVIMRNGTV